MKKVCLNPKPPNRERSELLLQYDLGQAQGPDLDLRVEENWQPEEMFALVNTKSDTFITEVESVSVGYYEKRKGQA